jgi:hypothetical protein
LGRQNTESGASPSDAFGIISHDDSIDSKKLFQRYDITLIYQDLVNFLLNDQVLLINEPDNFVQKLKIMKVKNSSHEGLQFFTQLRNRVQNDFLQKLFVHNVIRHFFDNGFNQT